MIDTASLLSISLGCFYSWTFFLNNRLGMLPWQSVVPDLHTKLRIISKSVSGLATDFPCSVWGRGWTTCLLNGILLLLGWCFLKWQLVCQFTIAERIFLRILPLLKGVRPALGGVCCPNTRRCVRTGSLNAEAVRPHDWTYSSHKPECIVTTEPDRPVWITIKRWHFLISTRLVTWIWCYRFARYSHCYVTWCRVKTEIVAPDNAHHGCNCYRYPKLHCDMVNLFSKG